MKREISFEFSKEGFEKAKKHTEFKELEDKIQDLKNTPIIIPITLSALIIAGIAVTSGASIVAYKPLEDVSIVAFKYFLGGL